MIKVLGTHHKQDMTLKLLRLHWISILNLWACRFWMKSVSTNSVMLLWIQLVFCVIHWTQQQWYWYRKSEHVKSYNLRTCIRTWSLYVNGVECISHVLQEKTKKLSTFHGKCNSKTFISKEMERKEISTLFRTWLQSWSTITLLFITFEYCVQSVMPLYVV